MIELHDVAMVAGMSGQQRDVLLHISAVIPSNRRIALLGSSNDDKRVFLDLLGGLIMPTKGRIKRKAKVSFPVGHLGGFVPELPVRINIEHLARLYDADIVGIVNFVRTVADLGPAFDEEYGQLPSQAKKDLARIVAYSIPFDVYLVPEEVSPRQRKAGSASHALFEARMRDAGMVIITRSAQFAREFCEMGLVLERGRLMLYDDIDEAIAVSQHLETIDP